MTAPLQSGESLELSSLPLMPLQPDRLSIVAIGEVPRAELVAVAQRVRQPTPEAVPDLDPKALAEGLQQAAGAWIAESPWRAAGAMGAAVLLDSWGRRRKRTGTWARRAR